MEGWKVALSVLGATVGAAAVLWPIGIWYEVSKCERPKYTVVRALGKGKKRGWLAPRAELRAYAPMLVAEVAIAGAPTMKEASSRGFRALAGFIFGKNSAPGSAPGPAEAIAMTSPVRMDLKGDGAKVAMTSPVRMDMAGGSGGEAAALAPATMSFMMPSKYTAETLPVPQNGAVTVRQVPGHLAATLQFRGHVRGAAQVEAKAAELRALIAEDGGLEIVPPGTVAPTLLQYHPPFTYGIQRVNEVQYDVRQRAGAAAAATSKVE